MRLLIVAPYYPPDKSVAVVRIASLTRYLLRKKYKITVLTNQKQSIENDESLKELINNIEIIEVDLSNTRDKYFENSKRYVKKFHELMRTASFDCMLITSGPYYTLPLCKIAKKTYNMKIILDFRDLWIFDYRTFKAFFTPKNLLRKFLFFPIEIQSIKYSDKVITVTDGWANKLKKIYFKYRKKIDVIYNGFDANILKEKKHFDVNQNLNVNSYNLVVFGKLTYYSKHYSTILFKALKELEKLKVNFHLTQIGTPEDETELIIKEVGINKEIYTNTGFCAYEDGIEIIKAGNVCILIDIRKQAIGTKVYDYIYANKPIIYIGHKRTYLSNFIETFEHGYSCQTTGETIKVLKYLIDNNIRHLTSKNNSFKYSREVQNNKYLQLIEQVVQEDKQS